MSIKYRFDTDKAIEVLLFITARCPNMYNALKVLYFADKDHLAKYGRLICGDSYVAMSHGPVPSGTYDIVKHVRDRSILGIILPAFDAFHLEGHRIIPHREPNLELLSGSDIECLDRAIDKYGYLPFGQLRILSHDEAFKSADENDFIPLENIIRILPDGDLLLKHLQDD